MEKTIQQQIWYEVALDKVRQGESAADAVTFANTVVDGFNEKFNLNPPATQE